MSDIAKFQKMVVAFRAARDWKQFHNPKDMALSLVLEAGGGVEHFLWKKIAEMEGYVKTHKDEVGEELADVLYLVLLMSHDLKIDILQSLKEKLKKNALKYPVEKVKGKHAK